jgi:hypothetical protein
MKCIDGRVHHHTQDRNQLIQAKVIGERRNSFVFLLFLYIEEEERVFFQIRQSPTKGFA